MIKSSVFGTFRLRCLFDIPVDVTRGGWISKSGVQGRSVDWANKILETVNIQMVYIKPQDGAIVPWE